MKNHVDEIMKTVQAMFADADEFSEYSELECALSELTDRIRNLKQKAARIRSKHEEEMEQEND